MKYKQLFTLEETIEQDFPDESEECMWEPPYTVRFGFYDDDGGIADNEYQTFIEYPEQFESIELAREFIGQAFDNFVEFVSQDEDWLELEDWEHYTCAGVYNDLDTENRPLEVIQRWDTLTRVQLQIGVGTMLETHYNEIEAEPQKKVRPVDNPIIA